MARVAPLLSTLLEDPLLADVPRNPTLRDAEMLIEVEKGSAMKLAVRKMDGTTLDVIVTDRATVGDLKEAVERLVNDAEHNKMGKRRISWKHVWNHYCLAHNGHNLINDKSLLRDYQVRSSDLMEFSRFLKAKAEGRHSHARRRRQTAKQNGPK